MALSLLWLATKSNLYGDFLHAGRHPFPLAFKTLMGKPFPPCRQVPFIADQGVNFFTPYQEGVPNGTPYHAR